MSVFQAQGAIARQCAYESLTFIAPGVGILTYPAKNWHISTSLSSIGYFSSCVIREEFRSYAGQELASNAAGATFGGLVYAKICNYGYIPSVLMSLGYSASFNYLDPAFSLPSIIFIETYTAILSGDTFKAGITSGLVFAAVSIVHDVETYTALLNNAFKSEIPSGFIFIPTLPISDFIPPSSGNQTYFNSTLLPTDQCLPGEVLEETHTFG